ncbi:MAG: AzlC family ABC transporter permease [Acetatifactor sp.]|nr:AzlC family ABC transporter permease [Acetatifactor sp.]
MTIPVLLGYVFLGIAFGLMLTGIGYGPLWAFFISLFVYAGSMQFVLVTLISGGANLITVILMTVFINGRHIFYGLSFIEKFKKMGWMYPYMVFSLTDETYSVLNDVRVSGDLNERWVYFFISFLDHLYWISGSVVGASIGKIISFNTTGIDFAMTALFVVIVINQWRDSHEHRPALIGLIVGILALVLLGPDRFIIPSISAASLILLGGKRLWHTQS